MRFSAYISSYSLNNANKNYNSHITLMSGKIAVFDFGEYKTRVGFAGQKEPTKVFPTIVDDQIPIENGIVTNWDRVEKLINKSFDILNVKPEDTPVLITESLKVPKANREKWTQLLFDTYEVPSFYIASQPYLSLAALGQNTGMVLCISEGSSYAVPVYESVPCTWAYQSSEVTGKKITEYWIHYLNTEFGHDFKKSRFRHDISEIKEKYFFVAKDYEEELSKIPILSADWKNDNISLFELQIPLNEQRFQCPELLFKPSVNGLKGENIANVLFDSIMKYPHEMRTEISQNIVLSGGTTLMKGFYERFYDEFKKLAPENWNAKITPPNDKNLVWKGGSIVADLDDFKQAMITKDEYDDNYASIVHKKCFT